VDRCHTSVLSADVRKTEVAAGQVYATLTLGNMSHQTCTLYGYAGLQLIGSRGAFWELRTSIRWLGGSSAGVAVRDVTVGVAPRVVHRCLAPAGAVHRILGVEDEREITLSIRAHEEGVREHRDDG
jgi:hypothetical protein